MSRTRYGLAIASAATLASLSCGALVGTAAADPGGVPHQGNNGKHLGQVKNGDKHEGKGTKDDQGKGHAHGHAHAPGQQQTQQTQHGDPPGNNGTVKIAAPSDAVGHPSNNPHPGCTVVVEWFGYDAGDEVVSTVSFAPQAPTSDVTIGGTSPSSVFVGGDAASGGTDLDGRQAYTLTFTGDPHPKQGYHVKLTVATPHSLGNDTKSKVFWVAPCTSTPTEKAPPPPTKQPSTPHGASSHALSVPGSTTTTERTGDDTPVPTAVDAGEGSEVLPEWARSPLPLAAVAGGLVLVAAGLARRARNGA